MNGEPITDFSHFARLINNNETEDIVFENKNGYQMVINHEDAIDSESQILSQYRIPAAHSVGLFEE